MGLSLIALLVSLLVLLAGCGISREERKAEFVGWYNELNPPELSEEAIADYVLGRARSVVVDVVFEMSLEEAFAAFRMDERINASLAKGEDPVNMEQILTDKSLRERGVSFFPPAVDVFEDGRVRIPMPPYILGLDEQKFPRNIEFLGEKSVMLPRPIYNMVCNGVPAEEADIVFVTSTALANTRIEDSWKKETLFEGNVRKLCAKDESSHRVYEYKEVVVFDRPNAKAFTMPKEPTLLVADVGVLELGTKLYFARDNGSGQLELGISLFDGTFDGLEGGKVVKFSGGFNPDTDAGTAFYYVNGKNEIALVAFGSMFGPIGMDAKFVLEGIEGFPYTVEGTAKEKDK
jgi:hypothetical protein